MYQPVRTRAHFMAGVCDNGTSPALHCQQTYLAGEAQHNLSLFKVGLPVEIGSFQVTDPILIRGVEQ